MINSIRQDISGLQLRGSRENLSLLFNRLCRGIDEPVSREHTQKDDTLRTLLGGYSAPGYLPLYKHALKQWRQTMENDEDIVCFEMEVATPLIVGKGDQNVHEFGITLQLPWGTPVIPGSAVKGILSTFAHEQGDDGWHKGALASKDNGLSAFSGKLGLIMFGGIDENNDGFAGCLDFFDAWWVPAKQDSPFDEDIINVHNKSYYQKGECFPDGMDSPVPNKFAVVRPGEKFFFAIKGTINWREAARNMLAQAAARYGFGAKTRVGYGRLNYIKTATELSREMQEYDNSELAKLYSEQSGNQTLHGPFQAECEKRSYDPVLDRLFKKFRPVCCFWYKLTTRKPEKWKDIKQIYKEYKNALDNVDVDRTDQASQYIFNYCQPKVPAGNDLPAWLAALAPSAADYLVGKSVEQIENLLTDYHSQWPPFADFKGAINQSSLDKDEKDFLIEFFFDEDNEE